MATKGKPQYNIIQVDNISDQIDQCVKDFFSKFNIDIYDLKTIKSIPHNTLNLCFNYIYEQLFKPSKPLFNNQKSLIDYDNIELLQVLANKFIAICQHFNKSLGLMSFCYMIGLSYDSVYSWLHNPESNPERIKVIKSIQESHKAAQIGLLNDTPVGAMAVANNDVETGLEWSKQQAALTASNQVFILPSERLDKLRLDKVQE
jgi:hypothetical protein